MKTDTTTRRRDEKQKEISIVLSSRRRVVVSSCRLLSVVLILVSASYPSDFIILSTPKAYSILNRYEQQLNAEDKSRIVPGVALEVISAKSSLGDGITSAMKTTLLGETYYLLLDDDGDCIGDKKGALRKTVRNCTPGGDTVRVVKSGAISLSENNTPGGKQSALSKGDEIIRLFTSGSLQYAVRTGTPSRYGWCSLENRSAWTTAKTQVKTETRFRPATRERILARMASVNDTYAKYFAHFNKITGEAKSAPQWQVKSGETEITCTLGGGYNYASLLRESTNRLAQDLASSLLGEPVDVMHEDAVIRIRVK